MANSELYGKTFSINPEVKTAVETALISHPTGKGVKRAKFILRNGVLTYQELKGLKNFFDTFDTNTEPDKNVQYALAGGDLMKAFIEGKLQSERVAVKRGEKIKQDMTVDPNLGTKPYQTPRLNEEKKKGDLKKNAVAIIVNSDNKILLLKRSNDPKQWMPSKWALVGGAIDKGETPEEAVKREIKEETGLEINKFINTFTIKRHKDSIETMFACRYDGDPTDIKLNEENTNYGWYDIEEINYLEIVPHLMEYITLAFKKYE
jgi:8-oxo-dGTP diphosphatase